MREIESTGGGNGWEWPNRGELKHETEILLCAAQEQALRVNAIKYSIDKTSDTPLCSLYNENTQYRKHHDKVGTYEQWLLCKKYHLECSDSGIQTYHNQFKKMTNIMKGFQYSNR